MKKGKCVGIALLNMDTNLIKLMNNKCIDQYCIKRVKPPPNICPENFCFHWIEEGDFFYPGFYNCIEEVLEAARYVTKSECGLSLGTCLRADNDYAKYDYYEPHEPNLSKQGLPWYYFFNPDKLSSGNRKKYKGYFET